MMKKKTELMRTRQMTWYERWSSAFTAIVKGYKVEETPTQVNHGANWNRPYGQRPPYDALNSLQIYALHGYMNAGVSRCAQDLAALDLMIIEGTGADSKVIEDGAFFDLMQQPNSQMDFFLFTEQLLVDLILSGSCYILLLGPSELPISLVRLHPAEVRIITNLDGSLAYEHNSDGNIVIYPDSRVIHGRNASWQKGPAGLYGTGATQALEKELIGDLNAQKLASDASAKGRPDIILSPKEEADIWGKERRREILSAYSSLTREGGALVLSGGVDLKELNLTPRDMEYKEVRVFTRESISSVLGIPGSVLGLPSANYATSRQQAIQYWQNQQKRGRRISALFTKIAKLFNPSWKCKFDYSQVEPLQDLKDRQLERIQRHIQNGVSVKDAYEFEGMSEINLSSLEEELDEVTAMTPDLEDNTPAPPEKKLKLIKKKSEFLQNLEKLAAYQASKASASQIRWKGWLEKSHSPIERKMTRRMKEYLDGAAKRYVKRLKDDVRNQAPRGLVYPQKMVITNWRTILAKAEERKLIQEAMSDLWFQGWSLSGEETIQEIFRLANKPIPDGLIFGDRNVAELAIDTATEEILTTSSKDVQKIIQEGILDGWSVAEISSNLIGNYRFDEATALMIARTETTRSLNLGASQAFKAGAAEGIAIMKKWLTADLPNVREAHQELGRMEPIPVYDLFSINGEEAEAPAGFGVASLDINCRCTIIPIVED